MEKRSTLEHQLKGLAMESYKYGTLFLPDKDKDENIIIN